MRADAFLGRLRVGVFLLAYALLAVCFLPLCPWAGAAALIAAQDDLDGIDRLIEANGLAYPASTTSGFSLDMWDFAQWDAGQPRRIVRLQLDGMGLRGALDVSGMDALQYLSCSDNQINTIDLSGLYDLTVFQCVNAPLLRLTTPEGTRLWISDAAHGYVLTASSDGSYRTGSLGYDVATGEVALKAISAGNARFLRWQILPSVRTTRDSDITSPTVSFYIAGDTAVVPVFNIADAVRTTDENAPSTIPVWLVIAIVVAIVAYLLVIVASAIRYRMTLPTKGRYAMPNADPLLDIALQNAPKPNETPSGEKAKGKKGQRRRR